MSKWFTIQECATELRCSQKSIKRLLQENRLVGIRLPGSAGWRIADPSDALRRHLVEPPIDRFPVVSSRNVAEIAGTSKRRINEAVSRGHLTPYCYEKNTNWFTAAEVRRFLAWKLGRRGPGKATYLPPIINWIKANLTSDSKETAKIVTALLAEVAVLSEPERSTAGYRLLQLFDEANDLLLKCRQKKTGD